MLINRGSIAVIIIIYLEFAVAFFLANLAANLKAAQDWLPYAGSITLVEEDVGGTRYMGTKVNLTNTLPAYASMGALVAGVNLDIATGTTTIELGQPPRLDYRTFVDRIRKTSQDNIVYL